MSRRRGALGGDTGGRVIPCIENAALRAKVVQFAEILKTESHRLAPEGVTEQDVYQGGLFRGAIERIRGQFSATMGAKREFMAHLLNHLQDQGEIVEWESAGEANRHDYSVTLHNGRVAVIELKGCLDGNNTNIFDRPAHAHEFILWSICTNPAASPPHNVWSGIHTRLSSEIISREQRVDGLVVWDWFCGTLGRPCPKAARVDVNNGAERKLVVGPYTLPPPCIYLFPSTIPSVRNNPSPPAQPLADVRFLEILHRAFGGMDDEVHSVSFEVQNVGADLVRRTTVSRGGAVVLTSEPTAIRRL